MEEKIMIDHYKGIKPNNGAYVVLGKCGTCPVLGPYVFVKWPRKWAAANKRKYQYIVVYNYGYMGGLYSFMAAEYEKGQKVFRAFPTRAAANRYIASGAWENETKK